MPAFEWWKIGSRIVAALSDPIVWVIAWLGLGLALQRLRLGAWVGCAVVALMVLFLSAWQRAPTWALQTWERQYAVPDEPVAAFHGFIASGGIDNFDDATLRQNPTGARLLVPLKFVTDNPRMKFIFSGGSVPGVQIDEPEADKVEAYLKASGQWRPNVMFERASRNTMEHARYCARLPGVDRAQRWLLVTSAVHMRRAMDAFQAEGWNVTAYPVNFRASPVPTMFHFDLSAGRAIWRMLAHEVIGLAAYRMINPGRGDHLPAISRSSCSSLFAGESSLEDLSSDCPEIILGSIAFLLYQKHSVR